MSFYFVSRAIWVSEWLINEMMNSPGIQWWGGHFFLLTLAQWVSLVMALNIGVDIFRVFAQPRWGYLLILVFLVIFYII